MQRHIHSSSNLSLSTRLIDERMLATCTSLCSLNNIRRTIPREILRDAMLGLLLRLSHHPSMVPLSYLQVPHPCETRFLYQTPRSHRRMLDEELAWMLGPDKLLCSRTSLLYFLTLSILRRNSPLSTCNSSSLRIPLHNVHSAIRSLVCEVHTLYFTACLDLLYIRCYTTLSPSRNTKLQ